MNAEQAYQNIVDGAKYEKGDPTYDWIHEYRVGHREAFTYYCKSKHFDEYLHDLKIWNKCKHVLKPFPLEDGEEINEDELDEDGMPINWTLLNYFDKLFKEYYLWKPTKSRLEILIEKVESNKQKLLGEYYENEITYMIFSYESSKLFLSEWIKNSGISTKQLLIEQLPLEKDINQLIIDLKIF